MPADVLAHLGNGNSSVGAKLMDRVKDETRRARQGDTIQAPAIDAEGILNDTLGVQIV